MTLASSVVNDCLRITESDNVTIFLYPHNIPLAEDIAEACFKNGADVNLSLYTDRFMSMYHDLLSEQSLRTPSVFCRAMAASSTAEVFVGATYDPTVLRKIHPSKSTAAAEGETKAHLPISRDRKVRTLSVGLGAVTKPRAAVYGFNFAKWSRMMEAATAVDYKKLARTGRALMSSLQDAKSIMVKGAGGTSLEFDVSGQRWQLSDGVIDSDDIRNLNLDDQIPAGSLSVVPAPESVRGEVAFNAGTPAMGALVTGVHWGFRNGRLEKFTGDRSAARVKKEWEESSGDKDRMATFSIGFNPAAQTGYLVNNVAYGAVTIGVGGNEFFGGKNKSGFFSFQTLTGATVKADGKTVLRRGRIVGK